MFAALALLLLPPPQATCEAQPPITTRERHKLSRYLRLGANPEIVANNIGARAMPAAYSQRVECFPKGSSHEFARATVASVNVEVAGDPPTAMVSVFG